MASLGHAKKPFQESTTLYLVDFIQAVDDDVCWACTKQKGFQEIGSCIKAAL